jgi:hypothetical protein
MIVYKRAIEIYSHRSQHVLVLYAMLTKPSFTDMQLQTFELAESTLPKKAAGLSRRNMMALGVLATATAVAEPVLAVGALPGSLVSSPLPESDVDLVWSPK